MALNLLDRLHPGRFLRLARRKRKMAEGLLDNPWVSERGSGTLGKTDQERKKKEMMIHGKLRTKRWQRLSGPGDPPSRVLLAFLEGQHRSFLSFSFLQYVVVHLLLERDGTPSHFLPEVRSPADGHMEETIADTIPEKRASNSVV